MPNYIAASLSSDGTFITRTLDEVTTSSIRTGTDTQYAQLFDEVDLLTNTGSIVLRNLQLYFNTFVPQSYTGTGVTVYDLSGNNRHITLNNGSSVAPFHSVDPANSSTINQSLFFGGGASPNNNWIQLPTTTGYAPQSAQSSGTWCFWTYGFTTTQASLYWANVAGNGKQINIHLPYTGNVIQFDSGGAINQNWDTLSYTPGVAPTGWNHYAFTKNLLASTASMHINGIQVKAQLSYSVSGVGQGNTGTANQQFGTPTAADIGGFFSGAGGSSFQTSPYVWNGSLASMAIYDRALTNAEIAQNYNADAEYFGRTTITTGTQVAQRIQVVNNTNTFAVSGYLDDFTVIPVMDNLELWADPGDLRSWAGGQSTSTQKLVNIINPAQTASYTGLQTFDTYNRGGVIQFVNVAPNPAFSSGAYTKNPDFSHTVSVWVYPTIVDGTIRRWITYGSGIMGIRMNGGSGQFQYYLTNSVSGLAFNVGLAAQVVANTWQCFSGSHDYASGTVKMYKNGVLLNTGSYSGSAPLSYTGSLQISNATAEPFVGAMGQILFYSRALSDAEVNYNYQIMRSRYWV